MTLTRPRAKHCDSGVTLVEILVVLAIMGIFLLIGVPAVGNYIRAARVRTAADTLVNDLLSARSVAVTTRQNRSLTLDTGVPAGSYNWVDVKGRTISRILPDGVTVDTATNFPVTFTSLGGLTGSPATCTVRGRVSTARSHVYTVTVGAAGKVSKTYDFNQP